jgi:hypothetical protein
VTDPRPERPLGKAAAEATALPREGARVNRHVTWRTEDFGRVHSVNVTG